MSDGARPDAGTRAPLPQDPVSDRLGIGYARGDDGACLARIEAGSAQCNIFSVVHGGVLFTMADTAMGYALRDALGGVLQTGSISITANYLRPVPPGPVTARATCLRTGRTVAFLGCDVTDVAGRLCARFSGIFHIRPDQEDQQP